MFQNSHLIKGSILDNVRMGKPDATDEEVLAALRAAQCMDIIEKFPDGVHTIIGSQGIYLSGGETQRLAIARAMLKNAPVVILDEATSSVDPENEDELQRAIEALTHDKTSTHEIARYLKITEKAVYRCMDRLKEKVKKIFE